MSKNATTRKSGGNQSKTRDVSSKVNEMKEQQRKWMEEKRQFDSTSSKSLYKSKAVIQSGDSSSPVRNSSSNSSTSLTSATAMSSHQCPSCQSVMIAPHSPCMLIPCGHSLCTLCSRSCSECSVCKTPVGSVTQNVMLEQVILQSHSSDNNTIYSPAKYETGDSSSTDSEIQNLTLRREMMLEEISEVEDKIKNIERKNRNDQEQIEGIERSERNLLNEISEIQKKILSLQTHKQDFKEKIRTQNLQIAAEQKKISLIEQTVSEIDEKLSSLNS